MRKWTHIILHHSLTSDGSAVNWQAIRRYHVEVCGWRDVGYHFGLERVGDAYEILVGRPLDQTGAHTIGMNDKALGICIGGNFDLAPPDPVMIGGTLVPFLRGLCRTLEIDPANIGGHRDYAKKSCPGRFFDVSAVRSAILRIC